MIEGKAVEIKDGQVVLDGGVGRRYRVRAQASLGDRVTFALRQDVIRLKAASASDDFPENSLQGTVGLVEYKGMEVSVGLDISGFKEFGVIMPEKEFHLLRPDVGMQFLASWSAQDIHVLS